MSEEEKQFYIDYCKYDKEPKEVILQLIDIIENQQKEIEALKSKIEKIKLYANDIISGEKKKKRSSIPIKVRRIQEGLTTDYKMIMAWRKIIRILESED